MKTKHSPTPWAIYDGDSTTLYIDDEFGADGGRNYFLAELRHGDPDELQANAEFIVRAVNSHDKAVAALNAALRLLDSVAFVSAEGDTKKPLKMIRAALVAAARVPA